MGIFKIGNIRFVVFLLCLSFWGCGTQTRYTIEEAKNDPKLWIFTPITLPMGAIVDAYSAVTGGSVQDFKRGLETASAGVSLANQAKSNQYVTLTPDAARVSAPSGGNDSASAGGTCVSQPKTREDIAACYRQYAVQFRSNQNTCEKNAADLRSSAPLVRGVPDGKPTNAPIGTTQLQTFQACADQNRRGYQYASCVASDILNPSAQYNPVVKACAQRTGFVQ